MNDLRKERRYGYIGRTALLAAVAAFLAVLPALIAGRGMLLLSDDFTWQQQIFNIYNVSLTRSPANWSWLIDLGSDPSTALSFYNLNSPFTLIIAIFPAAAAPYLTAPMLVLKYVTAAVGAAVFAKKFVKNKNAAVLCGLLYAFSGIQTVSLLFPFHDSMALFPWLLAAFEKLLEGKPLVFAVAVALSAMTNFYLFFGEVIFIVIWFVFRVLLVKSDAKTKLFSFGKVLLEGAVGVALAGVVILPSILAVASNPRVGSHDFGLFYHFTQYVTILQAYFMPADVMGSGNYLFQQGCSSCAMALPFAAMALVFPYIKKNFKKAKAYLPVTLVIISLVPVLNGAFSFFNTHYYARWFFMPALVFSMLSCVVIDRYIGDDEEHAAANATDSYTKKDIVFGATVNLVCVVLTMLIEVSAVLYYKVRGVASMTENVNVAMLVIYGFTGQIFAFGMFALAIKTDPKRFAKVLTVCVLAAGILTTGAAAFRYSKGTHVAKNYYEEGIDNMEGEIGAEKAKAILTSSGGIAKLLPQDRNYRMRYDFHEEGTAYFADSFDNVSMLTGVPSVNSFISTVEGGLFTFYDLIGSPRNVTTTGSFSEPEMALLSARFYLTSNRDGGPAGGTKFAEYRYPDGSTIYVFEYKNFISMGFTYTSYVTPEELRTLPENKRALAMLSHIVLEEEDAKAIGLAHGNVESVMTLETAAETRQQSAAKSFEMTDDGFKAVFETGAPCVAFVSAPYSTGFTIKINGETAKAYDSAGLIAIPLAAGVSTVEAVYSTPGGNAGMILTGTGIVVGASEMIAVILFQKKRKRNLEGNPGINNGKGLEYNQTEQ